MKYLSSYNYFSADIYKFFFNYLGSFFIKINKYLKCHLKISKEKKDR